LEKKLRGRERREDYRVQERSTEVIYRGEGWWYIILYTRGGIGSGNVVYIFFGV
jgi:hypothetical protein